MYVVGQLGHGGQEKQLYYVVRGLVGRGIVPDVLVWNYSTDDPYVPKFREMDVPVWHFGGKATPLAKLARLVSIARKLRPGVVHSYSFYTNIAAYIAGLEARAVAFGSVRSSYVRAAANSGVLLGLLSGRFPEWQVYNSYNAFYDARGSISPFIPKRVVVVRNGVDTKFFEPMPAPAKPGCNILGVGSLFRVKNWPLLIEACARLESRGFVVNATIVGEGGERGALEALIRSRGMSEKVDLSGPTDDIRSAMANSVYLVHVSDDEGCPNVIMEAMACGRAVVCTDAGDSRHIVDEGRTGFVVPKGNLEMLVDRMARLVADRDLCRRMGEAGRAKAEREFGLDRLVDETLNVYKLAGWRPPETRGACSKRGI